MQLLPSPTTSDKNGAGAHGDGGLDLRTAISLLPTPMANGGEKAIQGPRTSPGQQYLSNAVALLPTPAVNDMGAAYTPEAWDEWTAKMKAKHNNGNGHGKSLNVEAQRMLPTPRATDGTKGGPNQRGSSGDLMLPSAVSKLLPTPVATDCTGTRNATAGRSPDAKPFALGTTFSDVVYADRWGEYGPAIRRWEAVTRPAPEPTRLGAKGNPKLSDLFDEWLMGLPSGWITDVPGVTWNEALKACGNGVVPQQAVAALRFLLRRAAA